MHSCHTFGSHHRYSRTYFHWNAILQIQNVLYIRLHPCFSYRIIIFMNSEYCLSLFPPPPPPNIIRLNAREALPAGVGAAGLIADALTRLSKFTSPEFSPKKDCGVFFTAPVLAGRFSAMPPRSKGSPDDAVPPTWKTQFIYYSIYSISEQTSPCLYKQISLNSTATFTIVHCLRTGSELAPVGNHQIEFI